MHGVPAPSAATPEEDVLPPPLDGTLPSGAAAVTSTRARREHQPQPSASARAADQPPPAAQRISPEAQKALADMVVAFFKKHTLFNQDEMRCAASSGAMWK